MNINIYEQINKFIEKSNNILITTHAKADGDAIGAAVSTYLVLKALGKNVSIVNSDSVAENLEFLPSVQTVKNEIASSSEFIISINTSKNPIEKLKYNALDGKLNIIISPKNGLINSDDVEFIKNKSKFDLIFVLDSGNLEHLGKTYSENIDMFFETAIINIDHHASNTDFGQVNLVNSTASSTTEILFEYFSDLEKKLDKKLIDENIATLLLAGIITDTGSFQNANTSPKSMDIAAKLLDLGARQQEIIKNIYKTKKLSTLKLWGIILSKVRVDPAYKMVWSSINQDDFEKAGANAPETEGVIDNLLSNAPDTDVVFLIKENPNYISVSMRSTASHIDVSKFCAENGGGGHVRAAGFKIYDKSRGFDVIASEIIEKVRTFQANRLNIIEEDDDKDNNKVLFDVNKQEKTQEIRFEDKKTNELKSEDKKDTNQKNDNKFLKVEKKNEVKSDNQPFLKVEKSKKNKINNEKKSLVQMPKKRTRRVRPGSPL